MSKFINARSPWTLAAATAGVTALLGIPVRKALITFGSVDMPNHRSSHQVPTPRGGGIAALLGAAAATVVTQRWPAAERAAGIVALAGLGLSDDITGHVRARYRMAGQFVVGGAAMSRGGWDRPLSGVITAGVVNVVNFMDGINGISGLTAIVWGVNAMTVDDESGGDLSTLGALAAGAGLGFLPHNAPSARLFLGDIGSYAFGATMAAGILGQRGLKNRYRAAAPLLLYGADATLAILRQRRLGERVGEAHRQHVYQRLVDANHSHANVALLHALCATVIAFNARSKGVKSLCSTILTALIYLNAPRVAPQAGSLLYQRNTFSTIKA